MKKQHLFFLKTMVNQQGDGGADNNAATLAPKDNPTTSGLFSVADGRQVRFAPGNLVCQGCYYCFAAHQYDYGGLFGWGTGSNPANTSTNPFDYPSFDDWGSHMAGGWRTLTVNEWCYVIRDRPGATSKRGAATVCGVHGMVLLPDDWQGGDLPLGFNGWFNGEYTVKRVDFEPGFCGWETNVYDAASWAAMEAAGVVFLPAAGYRYGAGVYYVGFGGYWSSTPDDDYGACDFSFGGGYVYGCSYGYDGRYNGHSVRLARDNN